MEISSQQYGQVKKCSITLDQRLLLDLLAGFLMSLLRVLESLRGVLERLSRQLVRRGMVLFVMMHRRGSVRMGGKFVEIGGFLVRIARHDVTSLLTLAHRGAITHLEGGVRHKSDRNSQTPGSAAPS